MKIINFFQKFFKILLLVVAILAQTPNYTTGCQRNFFRKYVSSHYGALEVYKVTLKKPLVTNSLQIRSKEMAGIAEKNY